MSTRRSLPTGAGRIHVWSEYLVTRPESQDDPRIKILAKALNSEETRNFIKERYQGQIVPAF